MNKALYYFFSILFVFQLGCRKIDIDKIENLNNGKVDILGHGGLGFQTGRNPYPENSEISIKKALEIYDADGVEVDIQLSKDTTLILFHNDLLDNNTTCQGCLSQMNSADLKNCNFRQDFTANNFQDDKLISLEYLFQKYSTNTFKPKILLDPKLNDECSLGKKDEQINLMAIEIVRLAEKYNMIENIMLGASAVTLLQKVKILNPAIPLYIDTHNYDEGISQCMSNGFQGIIMENGEMDKGKVELAHKNGIKVCLFLVKDRKSTYEALSKSPDMIITDNIKMLQEFLKE